MENKPSDTVLFTGRHPLLDPYIEHVATSFETYYISPKEQVPHALDGAHSIAATYGTFGLGYLFQWFRLEITTPSYVKRAQKIFKSCRPTKIIALDFFRFSFWQSLAYVKRNPDTQLFVFCETQQWPRNRFRKLIMRLFLWRLLKNIEHITILFVWTEQGRNFLTRYVTPSKVVYMPASIDTDFYITDTNKSWLPDTTLRIICNARYASYKRHQDLFAAVSLLISEGCQISVTCISRSDEGAERVKKMVQQYELENVVSFRDAVPSEQLVSVYHQHDVLVLPSYNEAVGMVVPEAMACGLPTITSDTVGANTYVQSGHTGYIYETANVEALADSMRHLMNADMCAMVGANAREHIATHFSVAQSKKRFMQSLVA